VFKQLSYKIMYLLWVGRGREMVRKCFSIYPMRSHTLCGRKRSRDGEKVFLQLSDEITYDLWVGGRETVRTCFCTNPMRSRTLYGWAKAERR
jgi:hypothetical protein